MESPELPIILLNLFLAAVAYLVMCPKFAGNDLYKIALVDSVAWGVSVLLVGIRYWGSGYEFDVFGFGLEWFWFTLLCYFLAELPFVWWYFKKYKVDLGSAE